MVEETNTENVVVSGEGKNLENEMMNTPEFKEVIKDCLKSLLVESSDSNTKKEEAEDSTVSKTTNDTGIPKTTNDTIIPKPPNENMTSDEEVRVLLNEAKRDIRAKMVANSAQTKRVENEAPATAESEEIKALRAQVADLSTFTKAYEADKIKAYTDEALSIVDNEKVQAILRKQVEGLSLKDVQVKLPELMSIYGTSIENIDVVRSHMVTSTKTRSEVHEEECKKFAREICGDYKGFKGAVCTNNRNDYNPGFTL